MKVTYFVVPLLMAAALILGCSANPSVMPHPQATAASRTLHPQSCGVNGCTSPTPTPTPTPTPAPTPTAQVTITPTLDRNRADWYYSVAVCCAHGKSNYWFTGAAVATQSDDSEFLIVRDYGQTFTFPIDLCNDNGVCQTAELFNYSTQVNISTLPVDPPDMASMQAGGAICPGGDGFCQSQGCPDCFAPPGSPDGCADAGDGLYGEDPIVGGCLGFPGLTLCFTFNDGSTGGAGMVLSYCSGGPSSFTYGGGGGGDTTFSFPPNIFTGHLCIGSADTLKYGNYYKYYPATKQTAMISYVPTGSVYANAEYLDTYGYHSLKLAIPVSGSLFIAVVASPSASGNFESEMGITFYNGLTKTGGGGCGGIADTIEQ